MERERIESRGQRTEDSCNVGGMHIRLGAQTLAVHDT